MKEVGRRGLRLHALLACAAVAALLLGLGAPAQAQDPAADLGSMGFDVKLDRGSVQVQQKGQAQREFAVKGGAQKGRLEVKLEEKGGAGMKGGLVYSEADRTMDIEHRGKTVQLKIGDNGEVEVAGDKCRGADASCVAGAVSKAFPGMQAEEVAAALAVAGTDLQKMRDGAKILESMRALTDRLSARAKRGKARR